MDAAPSRKPGSPLRKAAILLPVLIIVAVAVNWSSVVGVAKGEKTLKGVLYGMANEGSIEFIGWKLPDDAGAEDAKVLVEIFVTAGDPCHIDSAFLGYGLGKVDPKRIRIEFRDTSIPSVRTRFNELKIGCEQGMAVNGKTKFKVTRDDPETGQKEETHYLTRDAGYNFTDFYAILDGELQEVYDGEGIGMSFEEFDNRIKAGSKYYRDLMEQKLKDKEGT